ncbi:MAG: beta-ketoacyl-[acyl-carrier-protein] synthase family protein [Nitrospirae bacterium]|nr:beta-ketoacyl-[acyl-carrier-protein] synthase family protein [Nitrospirota bacterium]
MRVVITGIGALTPIGVSFPETWKALIEGRSGIRPCRKVNTKGLRWKMAGEVDETPLEGLLSVKQRRRMDPFVQYALYASIEAIRDSSLIPPENTPVIIGSSRGGITYSEQALLSEGPFSAYLMAATTYNMASSQIAMHFGLKGISYGVSAACASGAMAVLEACRLVKEGVAEAVIAGASEAPITRLCLEGYGRMGALSSSTSLKASRPFDLKRDGFVLAEGACVMVIEELKSALKRGAPIYAEILSYEAITSTNSQTLPDEDDEYMVMKGALESAGLSSEEIDYINAHATSTRIGDLIEARAVNRLFGSRPLLTATKSHTGHMLGASSALEIAIAAQSIKESLIPPTINTTNLDPECKISLVTEPVNRKIRYVLKNSFGFGGINISLVLSSPGSE